MRTLLDKILRFSIKLCMLTGVAFTFAACYAPEPNIKDRNWREPDYQQDQQKLEQQLSQELDEDQEIH